MANSLQNTCPVTFTDPLECTLMAWAPDGVYLAHTANAEILVRNTKENMDILSIFNLTEKVDKLEWSSDSSYLAAGSFLEGILRIYCCEDFSWTCSIDMGMDWDSVGMQDFCWSLNPLVHHLITTANDYYQLTVWSLMDKDDMHRIKNILPALENKSFTTDGKKLAVAKFCPQKKYAISIYDTNSWSQKLIFKVEANEFQGLKWCPDSTSILIWDSVLYSTWYMYSPSGDLLKRSSPDGLSLGIHTIEWSPTGQLFAFINHSNKLRILNGHMTFGLLMESCMDDSLLLDFPNSVVYAEEMFEYRGLRNYDYHLFTACEYPPKQHMLSSPKRKSSDHIEKYCTKLGFSEGGYLATWTSEFPNKLWIWDLQHISLCAVLVQLNNIKDFAWAPEGNMLCLCSGSDCIYFWTPEEPAFAKMLPGDEKFKANMISWNQNANAVAISSDKLMVCHLSE